MQTQEVQRIFFENNIGIGYNQEDVQGTTLNRMYYGQDHHYSLQQENFFTGQNHQAPVPNQPAFAQAAEYLGRWEEQESRRAQEDVGFYRNEVHLEIDRQEIYQSAQHNVSHQQMGHQPQFGIEPYYLGERLPQGGQHIQAEWTGEAIQVQEPAHQNMAQCHADQNTQQRFSEHGQATQQQLMETVHNEKPDKENVKRIRRKKDKNDRKNHRVQEEWVKGSGPLSASNIQSFLSKIASREDVDKENNAERPPKKPRKSKAKKAPETPKPNRKRKSRKVKEETYDNDQSTSSTESYGQGTSSNQDQKNYSTSTRASKSRSCNQKNQSM